MSVKSSLLCERIRWSTDWRKVLSNAREISPKTLRGEWDKGELIYVHLDAQ